MAFSLCTISAYKKLHRKGPCVAHLVEHLTLDFDSGHDPRVRIKPCVGLHTKSQACLRFSLPLPLPPPPKKGKKSFIGMLYFGMAGKTYINKRLLHYFYLLNLKDFINLQYSVLVWVQEMGLLIHC